MNNTNLSTLHQALDQLATSINKIDYKSQTENKQLAVKLIKKFYANNIAITNLITADLFEECFSLQRLSLEHFFNIFALIESPNFLEEFKNNTECNISKTTKELIKNSTDLTQENSDKLANLNEKYNNNPVTSMGYSIYNAAKQCPHQIIRFYDTVYRIYSLRYAHSTFVSAIGSPTQEEINGIITNAVDFSKILNAFIKDKYSVVV